MLISSACFQRSNGPKGSTIDDSKLRVEDKWILSRCAATISNLESHFRDRDFPAMTRGLRMLIYTNLCDVYLVSGFKSHRICTCQSIVQTFQETAKPHLLDCEQEHFTSIVAVLHRVLLTGMKLLHPIMPFLTEELYHRLPLLEGESRKESIMHEPYPSSTEVRQVRITAFKQPRYCYVHFSGATTLTRISWEPWTTL